MSERVSESECVHIYIYRVRQYIVVVPFGPAQALRYVMSVVALRCVCMYVCVYVYRAR